jgi:anti-sigma factor RsiW
MMQSHLSDEAIAAFADGVLRGSARERARRHISSCAECAYAVAVQREAVWALRAAPAPPLPTDLIDRLRSVALTTPIENIPSGLSPDGSAMFGAFGGLGAAAFIAPAKSPRRTQDGKSERPAAERSSRRLRFGR